MRVIEPHKISAETTVKRKKKLSLDKKLLFIGLPLVILFGAVIFRNFKTNPKSAEQAAESSTEVVEAAQTSVEPTSGLRQFDGNEFRLLFDNIRLPNTVRVELPPVIMGDNIADARIRQIAESRGYKLRSNPVDTLKSVDGYPMQDLVHKPWLDLKSEASKNGITMTIVSGHRSVDDQRDLFLSRLSAEGVTKEEIIAGESDTEINKVLVTTSIPGYSKHHTGYVFDLLCEGWAFEDFKNSECQDWLAENNYEHAKKYGFIPSYPDNADLQGPDPEAWEYVYVGSDLLSY